MEEIWKDIKDYEGLYQVSSFGRVKSFYTNRILKGSEDSWGYLQVKLYKNGIKSNKKMHRLVAQSFIPNPENKPEVNHIDENKTNNKLSNLEWSTAKKIQTTEHVLKEWLKQEVFQSLQLISKQVNLKSSME